MIRNITIYATLLVGLVLGFAGFFAVLGAAYLFLGGLTAMVFFVGIVGTVVAGIYALFADSREIYAPEEFNA